MKIKLTDRLIRTRKPPTIGRLIITDTAVPGLSLRINPASTKHPEGLRYWLLRYRPRQQAQRSTVLGPYPAASLAAARQRASEILTAARRGVDLVATEEYEAAEAQKAIARARTVRDLATAYLLDAKGRLRSYRDV